MIKNIIYFSTSIYKKYFEYICTYLHNPVYLEALKYNLSYFEKNKKQITWNKANS